ncbi:MAG: endolytic transglycosylase MltG [Marinilabiliales bacterium]|nr:MAG: endolytic transglycosylase MltG [Marinilabiliales bacterium]
MTYYHSSYGPPRKRSKTLRKVFWIFILIILIIGSGLAYFAYGVIYKPNVWTLEAKPVEIQIPTGSTFEEVKQILYKNGLIIHRNNFEWVADFKKYDELVKPGNYTIENGYSNNDLINLLRSGNQTPVNVIFNNIKNIYDLAGKVSKQIEADSAEIVNYVLSDEFSTASGLDSIEVGTIFLPNTYEFYWNTSAKGFVNRMKEEFDKFWLGKRLSLADDIGLTRKEVIILASIVEKETQKNSEKPTIAGVYINRLERKWLLQADPTLLFALNDNSIRRVLNKHKKIDSPYNTYKHLGLPPGPICIPSISSVDAVLNYEDTDYLYFCARDDLSGFHAFAKNITQHNRNARKYQKALDELRIYK